jgi:AcrR family transcriptional regulator
MTRMSPDQRRSELLAAALRVMVRDGVSGGTTRAIVAEAGMPLASFHYVFRSRDEMMRELIASILDSESLAAVESIAASTDLRDSVRRGLQAYFDIVRAQPAHEQVLMELLHYSLRTTELRDIPSQQYRSYHSAVEPLLTGAALRSGQQWSLPVADVARIVVTITDGVTLAWLATRDADAAAVVLDFAADSIAALAIAPAPGMPGEFGHGVPSTAGAGER